MENNKYSQKNIEKALQSLPLAEPRQALLSDIYAGIEKEATRARNIVRICMGLLWVGFLASVGLVANSVAGNYATSEWGALLKVFSSDWQSVSFHWQEFSLSILQSLPFTTIIAGLLTLLIFLILSKKLFEKKKNNSQLLIYKHI